ncbi:hypothetical protein P2318_10170 [Myxococcaceae bacterium GXIMD 01537]
MPPDYPQGNDEQIWDWITWETMGNPSAKFRKGDEMRFFGLWRADYRKLCHAGRESLAEKHDDGALGRGWVKVHTLEAEDYSQHEALIRTFLPCMVINLEGKVCCPLSPQLAKLHKGPLHIVMPYNYDDNSRNSGALGTRIHLYKDDWGAERLEDELPRWSTASRSCIAAVEKNGVDHEKTYVYKKQEENWPFRTNLNTEAKVFGPNAGNRRLFSYSKARENLESATNVKFSFYSVKTGVQWVGTEEQTSTGKDLLEHNSVLAMDRSNLIAEVRKVYKKEALEARYQIEVLCVLLGKNNSWDGFQVRELSGEPGEVWFPALAIPSHGKSFAKNFGATDKWEEFWLRNFAIPLGRAKAEMLLFFGLQHMTANAQNMLVVFDPKSRKNARCVTLRDIGDTLLNNHVYDVLNKVHDRFAMNWAREGDSPYGITLTKGEVGAGYSQPGMTRIGTSIVFFFGPFIQGDILSSQYKLGIVTNWALEHNIAFMRYMNEKIGYSPNWDDSKPKGQLPEDMLERLNANAGFGTTNAEAKKQLVKDVLALHSQHRWSLIEQLESSMSKLRVEDTVETAKKLVDAHEMLICAEVESFLLSKEGRENLALLHAQAGL